MANKARSTKENCMEHQVIYLFFINWKKKTGLKKETQEQS